MKQDQKVINALAKLPHHEHAVPVQILDFFLDHDDDGRRKAKIAFSQKFENGVLTDWLGRHNSNIGFGTDEFIVPAHCLLESIFPDDEGITADEKMKRGSVVGINDYYNLNGVQYEFRSVRGMELSSSVLYEKGLLIPVKVQFTGVRTDQMILGDNKIVAVVEADFRGNEDLNASQAWDGMLPENKDVFEVQFSQLYHPRDVQRLESDAEKFAFVNAEVVTAQDGNRVVELFFTEITSGGSPDIPKPIVVSAVIENVPSQTEEFKKPEVAEVTPKQANESEKTSLPSDLVEGKGKTSVPSELLQENGKSSLPSEAHKTEKSSMPSELREENGKTSLPSVDHKTEKSSLPSELVMVKQPQSNKNTTATKPDIKVTVESNKKDDKKAAGLIIIEDKASAPKGNRKKGICARFWGIFCCN